MAKTEKKTFDPQEAHEETLALLEEIKNQNDEILEKIQNLDLPGPDYSVYGVDGD